MKGCITCRTVIDGWMTSFAACCYWRSNDPFAAHTAGDAVIFCCSVRSSDLVLLNAPDNPQNYPFPLGDLLWTPIYYMVLGSIRVSLPNGISTASAVFAWLTNVTNQQTDTPTNRPLYSVCSNCLYQLHAMRPIIFRWHKTGLGMSDIRWQPQNVSALIWLNIIIIVIIIIIVTLSATWHDNHRQLCMNLWQCHGERCRSNYSHAVSHNDHGVGEMMVQKCESGYIYATRVLKWTVTQRNSQ